jgi:hypothetical protein
MAADGIGQRFEQRRRLAHPIGQRRAVEIDPVPLENLRLAIERQVVPVLADQHVRQKAGARPAALDRPGRQRGLADRLAARAGEPRPDEAVHDEAAGDVVQLLGDVLAQLLQAAAAIGAGLARRQHRLGARQILGQRLPSGLPPGLAHILRRCRICGTRPLDLGLLERQIELLQALRGRPEALPAQPRQLVLQLGDAQRLSLGERDQLLCCRAQLRRVVGQGLGLVEHALCWQNGTSRGIRTIPNTLIFLIFSPSSAAARCAVVPASRCPPKASPAVPR